MIIDSPLGPTAFTSAPAFNSRSTMGALPYSDAMASGVIPALLDTLGLAPARSSWSSIAASSRYTAQWSAVAPSG